MPHTQTRRPRCRLRAPRQSRGVNAAHRDEIACRTQLRGRLAPVAEMDVRCAVLLVCAACAACAAPLVYQAPSAAEMSFMRQFGYLAPGTPDSMPLYAKEAVIAAVKRVQLYGNLEQTGVFDNATQKLLTSPRCGVSDVVADTSGARRRRFVVGAKGWNKRRLTYYLSNWTPRLGEQVVRDAIERAFAAWSGYARLTFTRAASRDVADIEVLFGSGHHGDRYAFDGAGNVLAHAYFPYEQDHLGGDMHFDADEPWTASGVATSTSPSGSSGVDFFSVAVHELGHSLGLAHSPVPSSVMFPYYQAPDTASSQGSQPLGYDDILGVYELYISRRLAEDDLVPHVPAAAPSTTPSPPRTTLPSTTPTTPRTRRPGVTRPTTQRPQKTPAPTQAPDICAGGWDAATHLRGELIVFKGQWLWRLSTRGRVQPGYPVPLRRLFPLPDDVTNVDAAYQRPTDESLVLIAGKQYWVFDGNRFIEGSPRPITNLGLPSNVTHIDAAQVWAKNGKTFLYSGHEYWRFDAQGALEPGYPRAISRWRGVPSPLDAALTWSDGATYFFQGSRFWRFDNARIKVDERYPLPAGPGWLGCPEPLVWRRRRRRRR